MARFNTENLSKGGSSKAPVARTEATPGTFEARIARIIELGTQRPNPKFGGKPKNAFSVGVEIPDQTVEFDGKQLPRLEFYRVNEAGKKPSGEHSKFTALLAAAGLDGDFELEDLIGKPISVTLSKADDGRVFITNVAGLSKRVADTVPELVAEPYVLDLSNPNPAVVDKLSDNRKEQLKQALDYPGSKIQALLEGKAQQDDAGI